MVLTISLLNNKCKAVDDFICCIKCLNQRHELAVNADEKLICSLLVGIYLKHVRSQVGIWLIKLILSEYFIALYLHA